MRSGLARERSRRAMRRVQRECAKAESAMPAPTSYDKPWGYCGTFNTAPRSDSLFSLPFR